MKLKSTLTCLIYGMLCPMTAQAVNYYVTNNGSNLNSGTTQSAPWQTIERVNAQNLQPGDRVLFKGGHNFTSGQPTGNFMSLSNASFETGDLSGWEDWGNNTVVTDASAGASAISIGTEGGFGRDLTSKLTPKKTYKLSFYAKGALKGDLSYFVLEFHNSSGRILHFESRPTESTAYTKYSFAFTVPGNATSSNMWFWNSDTTALVVDEITIEELTPPLIIAQSGTATSKIQVGSFGVGRATISAGDGPGISIYDAENVLVSNLNIAGSGYLSNAAHGISGLATAGSLSGVALDNLEVQGFGYCGIFLRGYNAAGFSSPRLTNLSVHDVGSRGIFLYGQDSPDIMTRNHTNVYIGDTVVYNCYDRLNSRNYKASGIELNSVNTATVEYCEAYQTGMGWNINTGGPVGIWTWDSDNVTIQYCESHHNRSQTVDGGGFDLDGGVTNSVIQYCYSHDNDASGYFHANFGYGRVNSNNHIRYNISENDAKKRTGAINIWGGPTSDCTVHNNIVYAGTGTKAAFKREGGNHAVKVFNNIFIQDAGLRLLSTRPVNDAVSYTQNVWFAKSGTFSIDWNGTIYTSLNAWRTATGQETLGGQPTGIQADPLLKSYTPVGTIGNPRAMAGILANTYQLLSGSPAINAGLDPMVTFGVDPGPDDFYGHALPQGSAYEIGAHEFSASGGVSQLIASEGFESNTWTGGTGWSDIGWTRVNSGSSISAAAAEGSYAAQIKNPSCSIARSVDLSGYSNVTVKAEIRRYLLETGDTATLQFYNGSSWINLETYAGDSIYQEFTYDLSAFTMVGSDQKLRLQSNLTDSTDFVYIDAIEISGVPLSN